MAIITEDTNKGESFTGKPKRVSWERLWTFSGGPFKQEGWPAKNIHTNLEYGNASGLPNKVAASATQFQGYVVQLMLDLFGVEWLSNGTLDVRFIAIVHAGDTLVTKAMVQSKETQGSTTKFTLDVYCQNQRDEKVLVGLATGFVGTVIPQGLDQYNQRLVELRAICTQLSPAGNQQLTPLEYTITPELNQQFLYAEEDFHPRYIGETENDSPIAHPALVLNWSNATRSPAYRAPSPQSEQQSGQQSVQSMQAGLHSRDETFFYNPARVGKKLKVTWTSVGSYTKRERPYSTQEILIVDEDEQEIMRRLSYNTTASQTYRVRG